MHAICNAASENSVKAPEAYRDAAHASNCHVKCDSSQLRLAVSLFQRFQSLLKQNQSTRCDGRMVHIQSAPIGDCARWPVGLNVRVQCRCKSDAALISHISEEIAGQHCRMCQTRLSCKPVVPGSCPSMPISYRWLSSSREWRSLNMCSKTYPTGHLGLGRWTDPSS